VLSYRLVTGVTRVSDQSALARVCAIVIRIAGPGRTPPGAGPDTPLHEGGFWLDSVETLEVIIACEEEFDMVFDWERELTPQSVHTPRCLAGAVASKLG
jgi:acyl carrier protein